MESEDYQEKFIKYLLEVEEIGSEDRKEVVAEFLRFFKFGLREHIAMISALEGEKLHKAVGGMRLNQRWIMMIEDVKEEIKNPQPKSEGD